MVPARGSLFVELGCAGPVPSDPEPAAPVRLPGARVGCASDAVLGSGVTVAVFDRLASAVADVRGPASATYDTASLGLEATFGRRDAIFFAGGSVYGLDAARGVRLALLNAGRTGPAFGSRFPLPRVSGAALYDLPPTPGPIPDYLPLAHEAAAGVSNAPIPNGPFGAGTGARVGKYRGLEAASRGGQGAASVSLDGGGELALLLVLNSVGAVRDWERDRWLAGARDADGRFIAPNLRGFGRREAASGPGTSLALLVTDVPLERRLLYVLAEHAHDGIARTVVPAHTSGEGDTVFAVSTAPTAPGSTDPEERARLADRLGPMAETLVLDAARALFAVAGPVGDRPRSGGRRGGKRPAKAGAA